MRVLHHETEPKDEWRAGVVTRMLVSAANGSAQLCLFQQWCDPGKGAPTHMHAVEEILTVLEGHADVWIEDDRSVVSAGESVIVPAGLRHGFRNSGQSTLRVQAVLAAPMFEAAFDDRNETTRRWAPRPRG
jgi:mannose-6-phosphate isomerase-like protein (cupin superfamily)